MKKKRIELLSQLPKQNISGNQDSSVWLGIFSLVLFLVILYLTIFHRDFLLKFSSLGYFGLVITNFLASATIFLPVPTLFSSFVGGHALNPFLVGFLAGLGSAVGDLLGFMLGFGARRVVGRIFHKDQLLGRFEPWIRKNSVLAVFLFAFFPNPFFDGVGLLAGALNLSPLRFFVATLGGRVLRNTLLALSGQKLLD